MSKKTTKKIPDSVPAGDNKPPIIEKGDTGTNYDNRSSRAAYKSEEGAKLMQMQLVRTIMENMGGKATMKEVQQAFGRMKLNIPQSTISARISDLRETGHLIFRGEYKVYDGRERKIFEVLPPEERNNNKIKRKIGKNKILRKRVRRGRKKGELLDVKEPKVITATMINDAISGAPVVIEKLPKVKKEKVVKEKIKKEKAVKEKVVKQKVVKEKKSKKPVIPAGFVQSTFFS